ncbi:iron-containing alcohol dehydrogenase [Ruminococcaceae bacterium OttesenSCG-928-A16]|nr:iron-containing alcohol dehydrogenase [Ruminococcaceae bacterium OttesenSCG-928-A16]
MFEFVNNRQVLFGEGTISQLPQILGWYGYKRVLFVSYNSGAKESLEIVESLKQNGIEAVLYSELKGEPDLHVINNGRDLYVKEGCEATIALGGGSIIDAAKAINMLAANGGNVEDYQMDGRPVTKEPALFVAVPTTSGTGAEATKTSVVTNNYNGLKKSLYHTTMIADIVILDPALTLSLPASLTASTGMDALSHAIESYVSLNANPFSEMYGLKAIELINENLLQAVQHPQDLTARGNMMLGSYLGGCAITAGIGIAHIMAQPVGAMYKIPHGDACSIFLPASMEKNLPFATEKYAKIAEIMGVADTAASSQQNALAAIERVKELRQSIGAPTALTPYWGNTPPVVDDILEVIQKTTGHIACNPRPLTPELMREMLEACR